DADVMIVGECSDGASALRAIARDRPDIVFLDVQMPELDGFEVVQSLPPAELPGVVFVTAYDRYALRAFDVQAIDYLLKPFTRERFRTALTRARDRVNERSRADSVARLLAHLDASQRYAARVAVRTGDRFVAVDWSDVDWIEAADNYVTLHVGEREYLHRHTLTSIERQVDPDRFSRVHRSAIFQLDRIVELHPVTHGDAELVLRDGTRLTLT